MDIPTLGKICSRCNEFIPLHSAFFHKNSHSKDGFASICTSCKKLKVEKPFWIRRRRVCDEIKPHFMFDGVRVVCRKCRSKSSYEKSNKLEAKRRHKLWRENNKDKHNRSGMEWKAKNKERHAEYNRNWAIENRGKVRAKDAKRRSAKLMATPKWADFRKINEIYNNARGLEILTGIRFEVDHVIPLQGRTVSGLHTHENLSIITMEENRKKGNKHD